MLYKAMQVKEIPIIFRGTINAVAPLVTYVEDAVPVSYDGETGDPYYQSASETNLALEEKLTITLDEGESYFIDVPRRSYIFEGNTYYYFGSNPTVATDPQDYPFHLGLGGINDYGYYNLFFHLNNIAPDEYPIELIFGIFNRDPEQTTEKKTLTAELTGNGQIKRFHARFACGENGTLRINPYVILNGNITVNLCDFAKGGESYISGDNEDFTFECYVPIETHALLCVDAENVGEYDSMLDVAIVVQYEDFIEEETIVGYEGINLGRKRR